MCQKVSLLAAGFSVPLPRSRDSAFFSSEPTEEGSGVGETLPSHHHPKQCCRMDSTTHVCTHTRAHAHALRPLRDRCQKAQISEPGKEKRCMNTEDWGALPCPPQNPLGDFPFPWKHPANSKANKISLLCPSRLYRKNVFEPFVGLTPKTFT